MKKYKGSLMLILAAAIWGTAFVAQTKASESVQPFTFNAVRSFIACAVLLLYMGIRKKAGVSKKSQNNSKSTQKTLVYGIICGVILFIAMSLQQYGIYLYPHSLNNISGRSGFITAMYVVLVPVCGIFFKKKVHFLVWTAVGIALVSLYLLCMSKGVGGIYWGDVLMMLCAVSFTAHIITIDNVIGELDGVKLSCVQFFVISIISTVCMLIFEKPHIGNIVSAWFPIVYAGALSSGVAYTLQILGQQSTDPTVAAVEMSLECVFAGIGGWIILHERLSARELIGCIMMFAAVILAQIPGFIRNKNKEVKEKYESCS